MLPWLRRWIPRRILVWITSCWVMGLIVGSLLPGHTKEVIGSSRPIERAVHFRVRRHVRPTSLTHRLFHWIPFGITAVLFLTMARNRIQEAAALVSAIGLGVFIEYAQMWFYRIDLETEDMVDDTYAVATVYAIALIWQLVRSTESQSKP